MHSRSSSRSIKSGGGIDKLDFDSHRKPSSALHDSLHSSASERSGLLRDDESFFSNIVDGVIERDRQKLRRQVIKYASFVSAILNCLCAGSITAYSLYGPLFLKHIKYTQYQVNAVSTTAELAMYLPVPLFGYLCDRYNPRPLSLASAILFGAGYMLAALTYRAGPPRSGGWPFAFMLVAFIGIGIGTACMYLSAVTTCAKNFGRGKHKGLALAFPTAAYGLSGLWQSQVGSYFFSERDVNGKKEDLDVYRYFLFLTGLLFAVGLIGAIGLRVVDEDELLEDAVDELERSGLLEDSPFFQRSILHDSENANGYGTLSPPAGSTSSLHGSKSHDHFTSSALKKTLVLNAETRQFLTDPTMWLLALGFFLTTGPGEAFINNLGTIAHTLYNSTSTGPPSSNSPATHISIVALTSTIARLVTGTLSDIVAPTNDKIEPRKCTFSRLVFLIISTFLFSLGQLLLASGLVQQKPSLFPAVSALVGLGYGAIFSLTPIIVSVVWGVQNFGTNWGIVAIVPAAGATIWGAIYSAVYQAGVDSSHLRSDGEDEQMCYGLQCYQATFWAMAVNSWVAIALWIWAWKMWRRKRIAV